jgi:hypothetical protein
MPSCSDEIDTTVSRLFPCLIVLYLSATLDGDERLRSPDNGDASVAVSAGLAGIGGRDRVCPRLWVSGLIGVVVFGMLGYGGVPWYYRRYQQFHNSDDHQ